VKHATPETLIWLLGNILVTTVTEGHETAITLTCTTPSIVTDARMALATLATALQAAARERRETLPCRP
jgi:hypothetical protein